MNRQSIIITLILLTLPALAFGQARRDWEDTPYYVEVWMACDGPELSDEFVGRIKRFFDERTDVVCGATWRLHFGNTPSRIHHDLIDGFDDITPESIAESVEDFYKQKLDKLILLSITGDSVNYTVRARELDIRTRMFGPVITQRLGQPAILMNSAYDAMLNAFLPITRVDEVEGKTAVLRVRASGMMYGEPGPAAIPFGSTLLPVVRINDRNGNPQKNGITVVPWTFLYLAKDETKPDVVQIYSGRRGAMGGRTGSRLERFARVVRPLSDTTFVKVRSKGANGVPLEGYEIYAKNPLVESDEAGKEPEQQSPAELLGRTDWRGLLKVKNSPEFPVRMLYVKSGSQLLGKLPLFVGADQEVVAEVANDDRRLSSEGFCLGIQSAIMDLVSRREILASRIRKKIADSKLEEAEPLLNDLRDLTTKEALMQRVTSRQTGTVDPDRTNQARIDKLFGESKNLINKYIDRTVTDKVVSEYNKAKQGG